MVGPIIVSILIYKYKKTSHLLIIFRINTLEVLKSCNFLNLIFKMTILILKFYFNNLLKL